jgi:acetolactate synthase-1/3 small subunit
MNKASIKKENIHTISILVANKPGVLVRCAQVFARRGFNIDALVVSASVNPKYSRMTVTAQGDIQTLDQIIKQTAKLIDVIHVSEHTGIDALAREFALMKIKCSSSQKITLVKKLKKYGARITHEQDGCLIIENSGSTEELDDLEQILEDYGIIEMVRSGKLVMTKGKETT